MRTTAGSTSFRARRPVAFVILLVLATACGSSGPGAGESLLVDGQLALPDLAPRVCNGDLRSTVAGVDPDDGTVRWETSVPWAHDVAAVIAGDEVITTSVWQDAWDGSLQAVSAVDGRPSWQVGLGDPSHRLEPTQVVHGGAAVVVPRHAGIAAHDPSDGSLMWVHDFETGVYGTSEPHAVAVTDDRVYVKGSDLTAVDLRGGASVWTHQTDGDASHAPLPLGDQIITAEYAGPVRAITLDGDRTRWSWTPAEGDILQVGASDEHVVVVAGTYGQAGRVTVLDAATGEEGWTSQTMINPVVALTEALVLVAQHEVDGPVVALDVATGQERWSGELARVAVWSATAIPTGTLVLRRDAYWTSARSSLTLLADDGTERWSIVLDVSAVSAGAIDADRLLVWGAAPDHEREGALVMLDARTGEVVWETRTPHPVLSHPAVTAEGLLAVVSSDFRLDCH